MSIDFQTSEKANYLLISCRGSFNNKALLNVYEKAFDIAENQGFRSIIVDITDLELEGFSPTTRERYDHGVTFAQIQLKHDRRIFMGLVGKEPIIDQQKFGETIAINRGAHCKVFTNFIDAVGWLERNDLN